MLALCTGHSAIAVDCALETIEAVAAATGVASVGEISEFAPALSVFEFSVADTLIAVLRLRAVASVWFATGMTGVGCSAAHNQNHGDQEPKD